MRTNALKQKLVIILTALVMICASFGIISLDKYQAKADGSSLEQVVTEFTMYDKQQVRFAVNDGDPKGMRFAAILSAGSYSDLYNAGYDKIEYGYFIMPAYYETRIGEINQANTFGDSAKYTWAGKEGNVGTYTVIHKAGAVPVLDENGDVSVGDYLIKGSVVGMFEQNLATKYTARMYIKATKGTNVEYKFATAPASNSSMIDVAIRAMDKGVTDSSLPEYITTYENWYEGKNGVKPTYSYTINYVDGEETVKTEVVSGNAINTAINVSATAPEGYALDSAKSAQNVLSGKVYADNNLTLTVYVKASVKLEGTLYNKELYHFEKRADADAAIVLPAAIGSVDSVEIGGVAISSDNFSYVDETKTLTISKDAVATLATGDVEMTISNTNALYNANVTVADVIVNSESELYSAFEYTSQVLSGSNYCTDYIILGNDITCESVYTRTASPFRMGTFDGKGHVIKNLSVTNSFTTSLQSTSTFKNVAFLNATNSSTSGFFGADSGNYVFDNVSIVFNENNGGGLVRYSAGNITFTNSVIIDLTATTSTTVGYISRTYNSAREADFTGSCVISDKAPFQDGTETTTDIYQNALAIRKATDAKVWYESLNGVIPTYLNTEGWSFDEYGNLCCFGNVVFRATKEIVGTKTNGELFYFGKNVDTATGYAGAYVANDCYNVTLPKDIGTVNSVSIANTVIEGVTYANKVLSIPVSEIADLANGTVTMEIDASTAFYKATVTIANSVLYDTADVIAVLNNTATIGASGSGNNVLIVLDGDIAWDTSKSFPAGWGFHLYGEIDGKGYAITNMKSTAYLFQSIQGGGAVRNIAFLNVTYQGSNGFLCYQAGAITIENVAVTYAAGASIGLVGQMTQNLTIKNTIVVCNASSYGYIGSYTSGKTLTLENSYCLTTSTAAVKTQNASDATGVYTTAQATVCADRAALLTMSENLKNMDSTYWSIDNSGNVCFNGNVVIANS